jgi:hypothetical protein
MRARILEDLHDHSFVRERRPARRLRLAVVLAMACWALSPVRVAGQRPDDVPAFEPEVPASGFEMPAPEVPASGFEVPGAEPDVPGGQVEVPSAEPGVDVPAPDVEVEGELDVLYEDDDNNGKLHHFLHENNRRIPLRFRHGNAPDLPSGTRIRVSGNDLGDGAISATSITITSGTTARTMGAKTHSSFSSISRTTRHNRTRLRQQRPLTHRCGISISKTPYGQTVMNFSIAGWFTIAASDAGCDYYTWATQAEAAASNAGFNVSAYDRRIIAFLRQPPAAGGGWET